MKHINVFIEAVYVKNRQDFVQIFFRNPCFYGLDTEPEPETEP